MNKTELPTEARWANEINCAITVCDTECKILYMNEMARQTFASHGEMVGRNMLPCHSERSRQIIDRMLSEGISNSYTITKGGKRKMIYQTPWRKDGIIAGLVEISMIIPDDMPHYNRD